MNREQRRRILMIPLKGSIIGLLISIIIFVTASNIQYLFGIEMPDPLTNGQITALIYISTAIAFGLWGIDLTRKILK